MGDTTAEATRLVAEPESEPLAPTSFCTHFWRRGWPTRPRIADASEWPISGTVPRKSGIKFLAADSRIISISGFSVPVTLKNAPEGRGAKAEW